MPKSHGPLRIGVGGPVGSGKTALMDLLCKAMRERYDIAAITNDIYTKWDAEFLVRSGSLTPDRIAGVEGIRFINAPVLVLDVSGSVEGLGKTPGKDARAGKVTYPALMGLAASRRLALDLSGEAVDVIAPLGPQGRWLAEMARFVVERMH